MRQYPSIIALICCVWSFRGVAACPDLSDFYPVDSKPADILVSWERTRTQLSGIFDQCLLSSEYFALYGAAQLNTDRLSDAMESLERSLLLNPDNGAALTDYAEALLLDGQLFAAIEANTALLNREDLPKALISEIGFRQRNWSALTSQTSWQLDLLGGFDDNLNGAPDDDLVNLTLAGEPILLTLNKEFRAVGGPFLNAQLQLRHRLLTPATQHSFLGQIRGRVSENRSSDVVQVAGRYNRLSAAGFSGRQWGGGFSHLLLSGRPLFTGTDARYRHHFSDSARCRPYLGGALQHQIWHEQRRLDGIETKGSLGTSCPLGVGAQRLNMEASMLHNKALELNRLGGDRTGWQIMAEWQMALPRGLFSAQLNHTQLSDRLGFSPLLENNARRNIQRSSLLLQYRDSVNWLGAGTQLVVNIYHQDQRSNLGLFETEDTALELGLSWRF